MLKFAVEVSCDSQFSALPEAIHLTGEMFGELGRADLGGLYHQQIQLALWKVIELLQFQLSVEQVAAKPLASLFLGWDVSVQAASQRGCAILRLCRFSAGLNSIRLYRCWLHGLRIQL